MDQILSASSFDLLKIAALFAAFFVNRQALVVLSGMLLGELLFYFIDSWFWFCIFAGLLYSANATVFIKLSSEIRHALVLIGLLYWIAAIDDLLFPAIATTYYNSLGYIVGAVDLYVLLILLNGGRRRDRVSSRPWIVFFHSRTL